MYYIKNKFIFIFLMNVNAMRAVTTIIFDLHVSEKTIGTHRYL